MKTSKAGVAFILGYEKLRLKEYDDATGKPWAPEKSEGYKTIGYGHLVRKGEDFSKGITVKQAVEMFTTDLGETEDYVNHGITVPLSKGRFDVLISWVFNIGPTKFRRSTLRRLLNAGDYDAPVRELPKWRKSKGKVMTGLVNRRAAEVELWKS